MRKLLISIRFFIITLGLLGCNFVSSIIIPPTPTQELLSTPEKSRPTQASDGLPQLTGDWHIRLAQTGGIAGVSRTLEISSDGKMTINDERTKKQATNQLSPEQLSKLTDLVASTNYQPVTKPMGCADCFIFDLQINNDTEKFHAQIDEVNLPDSGLGPLVGFLGELLNNK
jgi:hypothetical protein